MLNCNMFPGVCAPSARSRPAARRLFAAIQALLGNRRRHAATEAPAPFHRWPPGHGKYCATSIFDPEFVFTVGAVIANWGDGHAITGPAPRGKARRALLV